MGTLVAYLFLLWLFQPEYYLRYTQYVAFNYDLRKRRAISCDLSPSDVMIESQSNFNLQVSLV